MDDQRDDRDGGRGLTPRSLLAIALAYLGVSYLSGGAAMILAFVTGPFASPIVGGILLYIAVRIYRGADKQNP
jgi:hypothetical protein